MTGPYDPHGQYYRTNAQDQAKVNIAGRDQHVGDRYELGLNPASAFFTGRGPGRLLMVIGLCVIVFGFAGWASIVFSGFGRLESFSGVSGFGGPGRLPEPSAMLGSRLGSGIPVGIVYFLGFGFGGVLLAIGQSMAKAGGTRQGSLIGHYLATGVVVGAALFALVSALGGSPVSSLVPHFGSGPARAATPPVLVSDTDRTEKKSGLTLTVTRVENVGGVGVVHLSARNSTSQSISMPTGWFELTDGDGGTYEADGFGSDWNENLGAGAHQTGTVRLTRPVRLGTGTVRVEFTTLIGPTGPDAIAISGVPSR
jgi:hypothetical protein